MSMLLKNGFTMNLINGQVVLTQNMNSGAADGAGDTSTEGTGDAATEGTTEGTGDAATEGTTEGTGDGSTEGATEGTTPETVEGGNEVISDDGAAMDMSGMDPGMNGDMSGDMMTGMGMPEAPKVKDPILSNWFFVGGISAATLIVSIVFGILLAKKRIKKGIELYED